MLPQSKNDHILIITKRIHIKLFEDECMCVSLYTECERPHGRLGIHKL